MWGMSGRGKEREREERVKSVRGRVVQKGVGVSHKFFCKNFVPDLPGPEARFQQSSWLFQFPELRGTPGARIWFGRKW